MITLRDKNGNAYAVGVSLDHAVLNARCRMSAAYNGATVHSTVDVGMVTLECSHRAGGKRVMNLEVVEYKEAVQ